MPGLKPRRQHSTQFRKIAMHCVDSENRLCIGRVHLGRIYIMDARHMVTCGSFNLVTNVNFWTELLLAPTLEGVSCWKYPSIQDTVFLLIANVFSDHEPAPLQLSELVTCRRLILYYSIPCCRPTCDNFRLESVFRSDSAADPPASTTFFRSRSGLSSSSMSSSMRSVLAVVEAEVLIGVEVRLLGGRVAGLGAVVEVFR